MVIRSNYVTMCRNIIQHSKYDKTPPIPIMLKVININSLSCCSLLGRSNCSVLVHEVVAKARDQISHDIIALDHSIL